MPESDVAISACVLARKGVEGIEDALRSLQGWTDHISVIDNESGDEAVAIARRYTDCILTAARTPNTDALRNLAIPAATGRWLFFLDADECVPPRLGAVLQQFVRERGDEFAALCIPCKRSFCGRWMQHSGLWPGYKGPQLLKVGGFRFSEGLRPGVTVDGRTVFLPSDDVELAISRHAYRDLDRLLREIIVDTSREAESLRAEDAPHSWQAQLNHLVQDWQRCYEEGRGDLDGMHGFVLALLSAFSSFIARAKLWDLRRVRGELPAEEPLPRSVGEMLGLMLQALRQDSGTAAQPLAHDISARVPARVPLLCQAVEEESSDQPEGSQDLLVALIRAGESVAETREARRAAAGEAPSETRGAAGPQLVPANTPTELCVALGPLQRLRPNPNARVNIARARFESDWLPSGADTALNRFDRIWVATEFNRETFAQSGVDPDKLVVVPETLDPVPFAADDLEPWPLPGAEAYRFLSVFDWTLRKAWDVLLEAFASEFGDDPHVGLVLKVWSSLGYTLDDMKAQAEAHLRSRLGKGLGELGNIHFWQERLAANELPRMYHSVEGFVLPSRAESWCRSLMEAMAAGLPTIATAWGGPREYHNECVGFPLRCRQAPVSAASARETPQYAGHCWAEPDPAELRRLMRQLVADPQTARGRGLAAKGTIAHRYSHAAVGRLLREELAQCRQPAGPAAASRKRVERSPVCLTEPVPTAELTRPPADPIVRDPAPVISFQERLGRPLRLRWEIDPSCPTSSLVACCEICGGLLAAGDIELSLVEARSPSGFLRTGRSRSW